MSLRTFRDFFRLGALLAAIVAARPAWAQPDPEQGAKRPATAGRVTRVFDFEESASNPSPVPRFWVRAQDDRSGSRPGFPVWNRAELSYLREGGEAASGEGSVRLPTAGGSTSLVLEPGVVPVFAGADYLVSARVQTQGLVHARACVRVRLLDASGGVLDSTTRTGELVRSEGRWSEVGVAIPVDQPGAAYLQIELALLQPDQFETPTLGRHQVWRQDVVGAAWFDDVAVVLLPRVELTTQSPLNVIRAPETPRLSAIVRDLTGEQLSVVVEVLDARGNSVGRIERQLGSGNSETAWSPALTGAGWYRAVMDMIGSRGRVGSACTDFIWLPPEGRPDAPSNAPGPERERFGLAADDLPDGLAGLLPDLVRAVGAGSVVVPVWSADLTAQEADGRARAIMPAIDALLREQRAVTLSLPRTPHALARDARLTNDASPLEALGADRQYWMPYLALMMDKYGQRIRRWQLGPTGDDAVYWRPRLREELGAATASLATLVSGPIPVIPTRIDRAWARPGAGGSAPFETAAFVPAWATPDATRDAVSAWAADRASSPATPSLSLVLDTLPVEQFGTWSGVSALVRHAVEAWAAGGETPPALALRQPWTWTEGTRPRLEPAPALAAWRALSDRLAGRRVTGAPPFAEGVTCYVLSPQSPGRPGALVLWQNRPEPMPTTLWAYLGRGPVRLVDVFGNESAAESSAAGDRRGHARVLIPVGPDPIFVEGVDTELVRFLSAFRLEPAFLQSSDERHTAELVIDNPWPTAVSGTVTIVEPGGFESDRAQRDRAWRISPRVAPFSIAPGGTQRIPLSIAFSPVEEAGKKPFVANIEVSAEHSYGVLEVRRTLEVGNREAPVEITWRRGGERDRDLIVEATVHNAGTRPLNLELTAFAPGLPRSKATASDLPPGRQAVRRFVYPGAADALRGQRIVVSVTDPDAKVRINESIRID